MSVLVAIVGRLANLVYIYNVIRLMSTFLLLCVYSQLINLHRLYSSRSIPAGDETLDRDATSFKRPVQFRCPPRHLDVNIVAFIFSDILSRERRCI